MPDSRTHRGPHQQDPQLFSETSSAALLAAVHDMSWLLSRGYSRVSALKLVGDRYCLRERQRVAVARSACDDQVLEARSRKQVAPEEMPGQTVFVDAYNVLTTVEAALGGGLVLACRDGTYRDLASMKGTYRKVEETVPGLRLLAQTLQALKIAHAAFLLDRPVSNSGRLRRLMRDTFGEFGVDWPVELSPDPDRELPELGGIAASSDSQILDKCPRWFNLARTVVELHVPRAWVVPLA